MAWTNFPQGFGHGVTYKVGQRVRVWKPARKHMVRLVEHNVATLVRVTDTLLFTDEGLRYNRYTGEQVGKVERGGRRGHVAQYEVVA